LIIKGGFENYFMAPNLLKLLIRNSSTTKHPMIPKTPRSMKLTFQVAAFLSLSVVTQALTVQTTDFIPDGSRTGFNGLESIPNDGTFFTGGAGPYTEGGISVEQINGDAGNDIWVTYFHPGGAFGWYSNGGDFGFTKITLAGGGQFNDVGFDYGTGFYPSGVTTYYSLWLAGVPIASGSINSGIGYLGFSGGGFDEIQLSDGIGIAVNAAAVDNIEIASSKVPDTGASLALLTLGLSTLTILRRKMII
jgi:hypothetical protein